MMEMGNFRNAPYETLSFWSMKTALAMINETDDHVDGDQVIPSSQNRFDMKEQVTISEVLRVCAGQPDTANAYAYRHVRSLSRGSVEVRGGDWIICRESGRSVVGRVAEMVELFPPNAAVSLVRMMLHDALEVVFEDATRGHIIHVSCDSPCGHHYVRAEHASLHEVSCDARDDELVYTYIY
jgi:hypothetical protein